MMIRLFLVVILGPLVYHGHLHLCQLLLHLSCEAVQPAVASLGADVLVSNVETLTCVLSVLLTGQHESNRTKMLQVLMEKHPVLV